MTASSKLGFAVTFRPTRAPAPHAARPSAATARGTGALPPPRTVQLVTQGQVEAALGQHPLAARVSPGLRSQILTVLRRHRRAPAETQARLLHSLVQYAALEGPIKASIVAARRLFDARPDRMATKDYRAVAQPLKGLAIRLRLLRRLGHRSWPADAPDAAVRDAPDAAVRKELAEARAELATLARSATERQATRYYQTLKYRLHLRLPDPVLRRAARELVVQGGPGSGSGKLLVSLLTGFRDRFVKATTLLQQISRPAAKAELGAGYVNMAADFSAFGAGAGADYLLLASGAASSAAGVIGALATLDQIGVAQQNGAKRAAIRGRIAGVVYAMTGLSYHGTLGNPASFGKDSRFPHSGHAKAFGVGYRGWEAAGGAHTQLLGAYDKACYQIYEQVKDLTDQQREALAVSFFRCAFLIWGTAKPADLVNILCKRAGVR